MGSVKVSYRVEGNGPALYLVHGIGARKTTWEYLVDGLKEHFTCVTHDLRGHGESPVPPVPYHLDQLVDDLEGLRKHLGHERIHVAGHSLGGMIGPAYARRYPRRVLSVGLLSTAAGRTRADRGKLQAVGRAMETNGVIPVMDTLVERWYTDAFIEARPDLIAKRKREVQDTPENVFLNVFRIYATTEMAPWLHEIHCPCLVLTGELDGACTPRLNRLMAGKLPDSKLVILDNLKHSVLVEAPERVLPHVRDFLLARADGETRVSRN